MSIVAFPMGKTPVDYPPHDTPDLGYKPVPDVFRLPQGVNFGECSGVAINSKGHIFVLNRGKHPLIEFDGKGHYIRSLADGLFLRPNGLRIDSEDNIWATDIGVHFVVKMNRKGRILMVLGAQGRANEWTASGYLRCFNEPNDVAFGPGGEFYVTQGHGKGESRVMKFTADGTFMKTWGGEGTGPGQFRCPHSIAVDAKGLVYVADRSNQRIQVFDADGTYLRETLHPGAPCGLFITRDQHIFLAHGREGKILKLNLEGKVLGVTGKLGKGPNEYGEAHYLALDARENIYVADTRNWRVQEAREEITRSTVVMDLHVLSAGVTKSLLEPLQKPFSIDSGASVRLTFGTVGVIKQKFLAGESCDVIILTAALIDELTEKGQVRSGSSVSLGKVKTGIAVRAGEPLPDISDSASLRTTLLAASGIYFGDPKLATAASHFIDVLKRLGIYADVEARLRSCPNGTIALQELAQSKTSKLLGCSQTTDIKSAKGVTLVGSFAKEYELSTLYSAGVCSSTKYPEIARRFIEFVSGRESAAMRVECGFEV